MYQDHKDFNNENKNIDIGQTSTRICQLHNEDIDKQPSFRYIITGHVHSPVRYGYPLETETHWKLFQCQGHFPNWTTLHAALMETRPDTDDQQTEQFVYNIPCDCGWCHSETRTPLQVCIKEHKFNLTRDLLEKSKSAQRRPQIMLSEGLADGTQYHLQRIQGIRHMSDRSSGQSIQLGRTSFLDSYHRSRSQKKNFIQCRLSVKVVFICWYYTENFAVYWLIIFWQYSDFNNSCQLMRRLNASPHVCGVFKMFLILYLISCKFVYCAWSIYDVPIGAVVWRRGLALSIGPSWVDFTLKQRQHPVSETLCFK
jgi:hypothetical protein